MVVFYQFVNGDKGSVLSVPSKAVFLHNAGCAVLWNVEKVCVASLSPPQISWREAAAWRQHFCNSWNELQCYSTVSKEWGLEETLLSYCNVKCIHFACTTCVYFSNETNIGLHFRAMLSSVSFQCPVSFHAEQCKQNTCDYLNRKFGQKLTQQVS